MAVPFPTSWDPHSDGFGPMYEGDMPSALKRVTERATAGKRRPFVVWLVSWWIKTMIIVASVIGMAKLSVLLIVWVHPWP